jgi:hypothetical protein
MPSKSGRARLLLAMAGAGAALAGCVQLSAPERPIDINLNINIRQDVVVRLQGDARQAVQQDQGVF